MKAKAVSVEKIAEIRLLNFLTEKDEVTVYIDRLDNGNFMVTYDNWVGEKKIERLEFVSLAYAFAEIYKFGVARADNSDLVRVA